MADYLHRHRRYAVPLLFLALCILSFGLLIPYLGFYWDDWMTLYLAHSQDSSQDFWYSAARPLHAILDEATYPLLGFNTSAWQWLSLGIRWLCVLLVWRLMLRLWPQRREFGLWVALLFAVYPSFFQQASSVIYRHHWSSLALFLASLLFMLRPAQSGRQRALHLGAGLLTMAAGLLITEYMFGLEMLRPVLLWMAATERHAPPTERARRVLAAWWPYLALGLAFFLWRTFGIDQSYNPNMPTLLFDLADQPLAALSTLLQSGLRDLVQLLWSAWSHILTPGLVDFSDASDSLAWLVGIGAAAALWRLAPILTAAGEGEERSGDWGHVLGLALLAIVAGLATSWAIGRHITEGAFSDRFSLPAMLGASLFICGLAFALIANARQCRLVLVLLIGLAVAAHIRVGNQYRHDWERQSRFAWQLVQRAPALEAGTAIVGDQAPTLYLSRYDAGFMVNLVYDDAPGETLDYWYQNLYTGLETSLDSYDQGLPIRFADWNLPFEGSTADSLVLALEPEDSICLWLLSASDRANFTISEDLRLIAPASNLNRIEPAGEGPAERVAAIFGPAPEPYWCSYYQQAERAYQQQDWEQILDLWAELQEEDLSAYNGHEYRPFIKALMEGGRWDEAAQTSIQAYQTTPAAEAALCEIWAHYAAAQPENQALAAARQATRQTYSCIED